MAKLIKNEKESNFIEEAVFTAHGIILEKDLPPIKLDRYDFHSRSYIVQY